jgi:hypothetical protein
MTLNQIKNLFQEIATQHPNIASFSWGANLQLTQVEAFPLLHVIPVSISLESNVNTYTLTLLCVDQVPQDNWSILDEVWSDTQQVLVDIKRYFLYEAPLEYSVLGNPTMQPVLEDWLDRFSGFQMSLQLQTDELQGPCDLPFNFTLPICQ